MRAVSEVFGRFPSRRLRIGPDDEALPYVRDLTRFWSAWRSADGVHDYLAGLPHVRGPVLDVIGRGDRLMAHWEGALAWCEAFGPGRVEFWLVGAGDHGLELGPVRL